MHYEIDITSFFLPNYFQLIHFQLFTRNLAPYAVTQPALEFETNTNDTSSAEIQCFYVWIQGDEKAHVCLPPNFRASE